jgi:hypothetical protein
VTGGGVVCSRCGRRFARACNLANHAPRCERFPVAPLLALVEVDVADLEALRAASKALGRESSYLATCIRDGGFNVEQADTVAIRFGFHPCEVWGDAWLVDAGEAA